MKVKIITRHAIANYGSILQAYATEKIFEKLGYEAEIINYIPEEEQTDNVINTYIKNSKKWNKNTLTRICYKLLQKNNIIEMNKRFELYRENFLKQTNIMYNSLDELKQNKPYADIYCTGSDQVWGKIGTQKYDEAYFLEFLTEEDKCISYAGSFGKDIIDDELRKNLPRLMNKYLNILVRENTAAKILNEVGCKNVEQVLDPTLVLEKKQWEKLCLENMEKEPYILIYQLHHNKNFDKYAKKVSKLTGLKLVRINPSKYFKYKPGEFKYLPTPEEFLTYIRNAELVLTDSFHGTVFSLMLNKKFIDILPGITSTRITSILELVGLNERIVKDFKDFSILDSEIEFEKVNKILEKEREKSINCLKNAIK